MSEARADIPSAAAAMGLTSGLPTPGGGNVALPTPNVGALPATSGGQGQTGLSPRDQVKAKWIAAGATPAGAEGIVRAAEMESGPGLNPLAVGDDGSSFGAYQAHNDRALRLIDFAKSQNKSPSDLMVQTEQAIREATMGGDPEATKHRDSFMKATDPETAKAAFRQYFERPATLGAQMMTPIAGGSIAAQRLDNLSQQIARQAEQDRAEYERRANQTDPGSKERQQLLDDARARAARYRDMYEDFAKNPPPEKPIDALQNFGSFGTMLALLIGGMGRHHMNGALAAAGAMMQAANANDHEKFERQYKIWDHQTNTALQLSRLEGDEVRNLLEDKRMSENERQARLNQFYQQSQMTMHALATEAGLVEHAATLEEQRFRAEHGVQQARYDFARYQYELWTMSPEGQKADLAAQQAKQRSLGLLPPAGGSQAGTGAGVLPDDTASQMADQYIAGDKSVLQGLGYGNTGATNRAKVRTLVSQKEMKRAISDFKTQTGRDPTDEEKEALSSDIGRRLALAMAEYSGLQAGERSAFGRIAGLTTAAAESEKFTPLAIDASHKVSRTEFPTLNKVLLAYMEGTGNEDVVNLAIATNSLADAFAQVIGRGNAQMTDAARNQALSMLQTKWSQGQYDTAVQALGREIRAAQEAPEEVLKRFRSTFGVGEGVVPLAGEAKPFSVATPPPGSASGAYNSPDDVYKAFDEGKLTKEQTKQILIDKFGAKPQ